MSVAAVLACLGYAPAAMGYGFLVVVPSVRLPAVLSLPLPPQSL
jgi:hypothetical protein